MKKIGILTFYKAENYGAVLQAYALQEKIKELGYEANHIKFNDKLYSSNTNKSKLKKVTNILKVSNGHFLKYLKTRNIAHNTSSKFISFREEFINESEHEYNKDDICCVDSLYDSFICGSDMVWSDIGQDLETYFLKFTDYDKRISYAPSLTGTEKYSVDKNESMKDYINGIKYLSVREKTGVDYIKQITNRDAFHAVDPTLLLNSEQWEKLFKINSINEKKYILVYMFQGSKILNKKINDFAKRNNYGIRYIPMTIEERYMELKNGFSGVYGPKEFVELFLNASFIVTNSFHGLLFSINFNKPFALIHRGADNKWKEHENRMNSILDVLNIDDRYLNVTDSFENSLLNLDYSKINRKLNNLRKDSIEYLKKSIDDSLKTEKKQKKNISEIIKLKCTGCTSCLNACPVNAISMKENEEGFLYPVVDKKICIKCGKCLRVCQVENIPKPNNVIESYFGHTKTSEKNSASGGVFFSIANEFISKYSGYVVGASLECKTLEVKHIVIKTKDELYKLQNSKYVQSNVNNIYKIVKNYLDEGKYILFSGTPCQIAGLRNFLNKEYNNLFLIDIVCHGVPNNLFFKKSISKFINPGINNILFRNKDNEAKTRSTYQYKMDYSDKIKYVNNTDEPYYYSFMKGYSFRYSCYHCEFKNISRYGDITLGDCDSWRLQKDINIFRANSIILVNSNKGKLLFELVSNKLNCNTLDLDLEIKHNNPLNHSEDAPSFRMIIYKDLKSLPWSEFRKKYTYNRSLSQRLKHIIKKIIGR